MTRQTRQFVYEGGVSTAILTSGDFVFAYLSIANAGTSSQVNSVIIRRFSSTGTALSAEQVVNASGGPDANYPSVTALPGGGFIVLWGDNLSDRGGVLGRFYDSAGTASSPPFQISTTPARGTTAYYPRATVLRNGDIAVSWLLADYAAVSAWQDCWGQILSPTGTMVGSEMHFGATSPRGIQIQGVAALSNSGFVVFWIDWGPSAISGNSSELRFQVFDSSYAPVGGRVAVNGGSGTTSPSVIGLPTGSFVVTWQDEITASGDQSGARIRGQLFTNTGTADGDKFQVNTATVADQRGNVTALLAGGGFVAVWSSSSSDTPRTFVIKGQAFSATASKLGDEFTISSQTTTISQSVVDVLPLPSGGFGVLWTERPDESWPLVTYKGRTFS